MQMNRLAAFFAVVLCSGFAVDARASEPVASDISDSSLSAMGLSGMTVMADEQGSKVRGMGSTAVNGGSFAFGWLLGLTYSHNTYTANSADVLAGE